MTLSHLLWLLRLPPLCLLMMLTCLQRQKLEGSAFCVWLFQKPCHGETYLLKSRRYGLVGGRWEDEGVKNRGRRVEEKWTCWTCTFKAVAWVNSPPLAHSPNCYQQKRRVETGRRPFKRYLIGLSSCFRHSSSTKRETRIQSAFCLEEKKSGSAPPRHGNRDAARKASKERRKWKMASNTSLRRDIKRVANG